MDKKYQLMEQINLRRSSHADKSNITKHLLELGSYSMWRGNSDILPKKEDKIKTFVFCSPPSGHEILTQERGGRARLPEINKLSGHCCQMLFRFFSLHFFIHLFVFLASWKVTSMFCM